MIPSYFKIEILAMRVQFLVTLGSKVLNETFCKPSLIEACLNKQQK